MGLRGSDPPYFDNVSYSELSDFYLAWQQALGIADGTYADVHQAAPIEENLAVARRTPGAIATYRNMLSTIFRECARVLRKDGLCV